MSRRAFANVEKSFVGEAERAFDFLTKDFRMVGAERHGVVIKGVAFVGLGVRYRISLDPDDKAVSTRVEMDSGAARLVAELDSLILAAGIESRERVPRSAHTLNGLRQALEGQARFVRLLLPLMSVPSAIDLMRKANAREWHIK